MLKDSSNPKFWTNEKIRFLITITVLALLYFTINKFFLKREAPGSDNHPNRLIMRQGSDSVVIDFTDWDSTKIDSFVRTLHQLPTLEEDSMYKTLGLDELDGMVTSPPSPLFDSLVKEKK